jgi:predicted DNA-binding transcriptional regulator YafY
VEYVSFNTPAPEVRVIAPHTLVFSGARWHLRAYCEKNRDYRDFVLSRFRGEADLMDTSPNPADADLAWNTGVDIHVVPDTRLDAHQRAIIERDYGMTDGRLSIRTRGALVQYMLQLLRVDPNILDAKPHAQQIIVENLAEIRRWLFA